MRGICIKYDQNENLSSHYKEHEWLTTKCPLTFEAQQKYLDYLYLVNSGRKAVESIKLSRIAIAISVSALLVNVCFNVYKEVKTEKPLNVQLINIDPITKELDTIEQQLKLGHFQYYPKSSQKKAKLSR